MKIIPTLLLCLVSTWVFSQEQPATRQYATAARDGEIVIDGKLDDEAWNQVEWTGDFIQRFPDYGVAPSEQTQFKILYDAKFLYVGVRAFDSDPSAIVKRLSRRDGFEGDWVEINIDSYNDKRTAFSFTATVSGVIGDEYISNNGDDWDDTWDPIWYLKTSIDDLGWIAEFKIPLSQLRFADVPVHTWGIQLTRRFFRNEERSVWQPIAQDAPGWVHLFGELKGIKGIKPQKQLEILPYVLAKAELTEKEEGNPFATGQANSFDAGVDAKIGLTSDITLDLTINPDFGQVEADPSQVNLSAFRLFFQERRPFFLEGSNILTFPTGDGNNLFYSRRIGKSPSFFPDADSIAYVDQPSFTRIWGAAKLTGKNKKGFSWGLLEAVTNREKAEVQHMDGRRSKIAVEPATNYLVGRFQQDINEGNTVVGAILTSTNRFVREEDSHLDFLHDNAYSGGIDVTHNFLDRKYYVSFKSAFSHINGTPESVLLTQTASERFFQRPDNRHHDVDSTLTKLNGSSGSVNVGKAQGKLRYNLSFAYTSPEFETNDLGFLRQSDIMSQDFWMQYRTLKTFGIFRSIRMNINQWAGWDFDGINTSQGYNFNAHAEFKNYWSFGNGSTYRAHSVSNADLRGGPSITYPGGTNYWYYIGTNSQKKLTLNVNQWFFRGFENYSWESGINTRIFWQPMNALSLNLQPSVSWSRNDLQYIQTSSFGAEDRFMLGRINQATYRISFRSTFNLTPNFSVELWAQPFMTRGEYSSYKLAVSPHAEAYEDRFLTLESDQISWNEAEETYTIDENRDGVSDYTMDNPDFNVVQFRSNFVVRWEYIQGSTLFLVWSSNGSDFNQLNDNGFRNLGNQLTNITADHTFLVKYTYRFIL